MSILDIYATDHRGITFIVEMQVAYVASIFKRFTYYVGKEYGGQIESGDDYPKLRPVIFIGVLDFVLLEETEADKNKQDNGNENFSENENSPDDDLEKAQADVDKSLIDRASTVEKKHSYLSCHKILDVETHANILQDMSFYFIELPRFTKKEHELVHILDKWVYFIKNAKDLDVIPDHVDEPDLHTAYELANQFGWKQEDLQQYEYRGIKIQDQRGAITHAQNKGLVQGREEGREEGHREGHEKGLEEGRRKGEESAMLKVAQSMLAMELPLEQIIEATGLSAAQIKDTVDLT